jgi:hypothetical protein
MSFEPAGGPLPDLATTRLGGGTSARLAAVAVACALIGVVSFALVNRPPAPVPVAAAPTRAPTGQPTAPAASPTPSPPRSHSGEQPSPRHYRYEVSMTIVGGVVRVPLERTTLAEVHDGFAHFSTIDVGSTLALDISRSWTLGGLHVSETFDAWTIPLKALRNSRGGLVELLVAHVPPASSGPDGPEPLASGYTLTVLGRRQNTDLTLAFELVWPLATR